MEHRASFTGQRTSLLSQVVADADTIDSLNFERILAYTLDWVPDGDAQARIRHMYDHYLDKHGQAKGYAKLDLALAEEMMRPRRELLWKISENYDTFKTYFLENYREWF